MACLCVMAALEAATHRVRVSGRSDSIRLADARVMGGRVTPGHDDPEVIAVRGAVRYGAI